MFLSNHTLTGVVLGLNVSNPALLIASSFTSHLALDSVPHFGHPDIDISRGMGLKLAITDGLVSVGILIGALILFPSQAGLVAVGTFFACLPDLLYIPRYLFGWVPSVEWSRFHKWVQWSESPPGLITEIAWAGMMLFILTS